jgi:hypothetical protein
MSAGLRLLYNLYKATGHLPSCRCLSISKFDCSNTRNRTFFPNSLKYFIKLVVVLHSFFHFWPYIFCRQFIRRNSSHFAMHFIVRFSNELYSELVSKSSNISRKLLSLLVGVTKVNCMWCVFHNVQWYWSDNLCKLVTDQWRGSLGVQNIYKTVLTSFFRTYLRRF